MNPIWPSENTPVKPLVRLRLTVRIDEQPEVDRQALPERLAARPEQRERDGREDDDEQRPGRPRGRRSQRLLPAAPAEDALGPDEQHEDEDDEHERVPVAGERARQPRLEQAAHLGRHGARRQDVADARRTP